MENIVNVLGMVWYRREDYSAIRGIMADSNKLPTSFDIWLAKAESGEKKFRSDGHFVVRAFIDPKTFPDWCRARNLNIDAQARMTFANSVATDYVRRQQAESGIVH